MKTPNADRPQPTDLQRRLIIAVATGAALIAAIGFVGSYAAVAKLAAAKGFGAFAHVFPVGIDAGILVLLALDLLLTWLRMPLAMLRHTAWLLTTATIAFNAAAAWPDPIGTGMHAVIPILFVVVVEAARHAIGRTADITAGRHMDSVRMARWFLDPISTFRLWRRMKLWELRSYDHVIALEQSRLVERARLRARYGRGWRRKAPVSAVMALRLTRYGRALAPVSGVLDIEHAPAFEAAANQAIDMVQEAEDTPPGHPDTETDTTPDTSGQPDNEPDTESGQDEPTPDAEPVTSPDTRPDSPDVLSAIASAASGPADLVKALAAQGVPASALVSEAVRLRPDMVADSIRRTAKRLQAAADGGPYR
ncbi:DUF2637 domain-containing protein [Streptomyces mirabilis]|uniref:DUF2637 domain-containing protein n=1 Tax=Streptomyces mirabilis TaxID=68239 RepID=UPI0035D6C1A9